MHFLFLDIIFRFGEELCVLGKTEAKALVINGKKEVYFASSPFFCSLVWLIFPYPLSCTDHCDCVTTYSFSSIYQYGSRLPNDSRDSRKYNLSREDGQSFFLFFGICVVLNYFFLLIILGDSECEGPYI